MYDEVTQCPECGAHLDRDFETELKGEEVVEYTTCQGEPPHRWRIRRIHRDRSVWFYDLSGPTN